MSVFSPVFHTLCCICYANNVKFRQAQVAAAGERVALDRPAHDRRLLRVTETGSHLATSQRAGYDVASMTGAGRPGRGHASSSRMPGGRGMAAGGNMLASVTDSVCEAPHGHAVYCDV